MNTKPITIIINIIFYHHAASFYKITFRALSLVKLVLCEFEQIVSVVFAIYFDSKIRTDSHLLQSPFLGSGNLKMDISDENSMSITGFNKHEIPKILL